MSSKDRQPLLKYIEKGHACPVHFANQTWLLDGRASLFCMASQTLIVSDLHFEKASFLNQHGNLLPRLDTLDTIKRLAQLIDKYLPQRLVCLGDSFHDRRALDRMSEIDLDTLFGLIEQVKEWIWIQGNHDPDLPDWLTGRITDSIEIGDALLLHEPEFKNTKAQIVGHFHPKLSHKLGPRRVTGKCMVHSTSLMILPSFGSYTGGLSVNDDAIASLFDGQEQARHLLHNNKVWPVAVTGNLSTAKPSR